MTAQKFDWTSVGGRPEQADNMQSQSQKFDWASVGGRPHEEGQSPTSALGAEGQYLKGLGKGTLKKLGEFGSSIANLIPGVHTKPLYEPSNPESEVEASGQRMGASPAELLTLLPPLRAAKLIASAPEGASMIARLLQSGKKIGAVGTAGALEGLAIGEPNRLEKAEELGKESAAMEGLGQLISKGLSFRPSSQYKQAEKGYQQALGQQEAAEHSLKTAQGRAIEEVGLSTPERIIPRMETRNAAIEDALHVMQTLPTETMPTEIMHTAYTQLPKIAEANLSELNTEIAKAMGKGHNPDKPLAREVTDYFEGVKNPATGEKEGGLKQEIGEEFNSVRADLENKKFNLPQRIDEKEIRRMAEASLSNVNASEENIKKIEDLIRSDIKSKGGKSISASTYFDAYRSLGHDINDEIYYLRRNRGKLSTDEIKAQNHKIADMQQKYNDMEDTISNQSSPEIIQRLNKAKDRWANEYAPLRQDPIYRKMVDEGIVDTKDVMHSIRGDDRASTILRRHFQTNPKASELLANYQFADNPAALQSLTPYQQQFINPKLTPKISEFINQQNAAVQNVSKAHQQASHFEELSKSIQQEQKRHNEMLSQREKLEKQIPEWQKEIESLSKHEQILRKEIENKKLSKEEVQTMKGKLAEAKRKKEKFSRYLSGALKYGALEEYLRHHHTK